VAVYRLRFLKSAVVRTRLLSGERLMSRRNRVYSFFARVCVAFLLLAATEALQATTLTFDPNLSNGANPGGGGTWDLSTTSNWFNGASDQQWTDTTGVDSANFTLPSAGNVALANSLAANNLTFSYSGYSLTGGSTLTIGGATPTVSNSPLVVGNTTIGVPVSLGAAQTWTVGGASTIVDNGTLSGAGVLTKAGAGTLTLNGNNSGYAAGVTLSAGLLNIGNANALGSGTFTMSGNAGIIDNSTGAPLTIAGNIPIQMGASPTFVITNDLNFGTGTVTSSASRTFTVKVGNLTFGGNMNLGAGHNLTKQGGGTLTLLGSGNSYDQTIINDGIVDFGSTGILGSNSLQLTISGGELRMAGSATRTSQASGNLTLGVGRDVVTLSPIASAPLSLTPAAFGTRSQGASLLFRGDNIGSAPGNGVATVSVGTAPTVTTGNAVTDLLSALSGAAGLGTTSAAVFRAGLADTSATGNGAGFATYDTTNPGSGVIGVRLLSGAEQDTSGYPGLATQTNVRLNLAGAIAITGVQTNTLQLDNTSGVTQTVTNSGTALDPRNGLLFSGNSAITLTGGTLTSTGGDAVIMSTNTGGVTLDTAVTDSGGGGTIHSVLIMGPGNLTVTKTLTASGNGSLWFEGPGTVTLNAAMSPSSGGITVTGGTVVLGSAFSMGSARQFITASGATIDMNGTSVANVEGITDFNGLGGTITNSSATTATLTLFRTSNLTSSRPSSGVITGNINLVMNFSTAATTGTQTLSGQSTYTGTTTISSGALILGVTNALPVGTALTVNGGGVNASVLNLAGINQTVGSLAGNGGTIGDSTASTTSILTINGGGGQSYSGTLQNGTGTLSLVKTGVGTQSLGGANTYSGGTIVAGGLLSLVNASATSATGTGAVTVLSGGTLGGNGFIITAGNAGVTVWGGGKLSPGTSPGILHMDLGTGLLDISQAVAALNSQSMLFDLDTPATSDEVQLANASSSLKIGNGSLEFDDFAFTPTGSFGPGTYTLFDTSNNINGTLGSNLSGTIAGFNATLSTADSGHDIVLTVSAVPEPATLVLFGLGAVALGATYRRRCGS
jgi:autotransporter-associated beta strand protein